MADAVPVQWYADPAHAITEGDTHPAGAGREGVSIAADSPRLRGEAVGMARGVRPSWQLNLDRDVDILRWMGRHGPVTRRQVAEKFFPSQKAGDRRIRKLIELGYLRNQPTADHPGVSAALLVTRSGMAQAGLQLSPPHFSPTSFRHSVAVVDLTERILREHPGLQLTTERELRSTYAVLRQHRRPVPRRIPDAQLLWPETGQSAALELDLTQKANDRYREIIRIYVGEEWTKVWWYCPTARTAATLSRIVSERPIWQRLVDVRVWQP